MSDAENITVTESWAVVYEGTDERTIACVSGQGEIWQSAAEPVNTAIGLPIAGRTVRGSGRILGRAIYGTKHAVFIVL